MNECKNHCISYKTGEQPLFKIFEECITTCIEETYDGYISTEVAEYNLATKNMINNCRDLLTICLKN